VAEIAKVSSVDK
jgi:hypothetical protein